MDNHAETPWARKQRQRRDDWKRVIEIATARLMGEMGETPARTLALEYLRGEAGRVCRMESNQTGASDGN